MASTLISSLAILLAVTLVATSNYTRISRMDILGWVCNNGTVSRVEAYRRSYQVNLDAIKDEMKRVKFGIHDHGYSLQKMYLLSQCFSDLSPDECNICWSRATDLLSQCFPVTSGWFHLDGY